MDNNDSYGTMEREKMKQSMEKPWRATNRKEDWRPTAWHEIGAWFVASIILLAFCVVFWLAFSAVEQLLRG